MTDTPTPDQRRAIEAPPGATLVVAGPGAGKTFCLIGRIHHLIRRHDYPPERLCALTFTNKAAEEIASRLERGGGGGGGGGDPAAGHVTRGTLHALCLDVLRRHPEPAGLRPGFGVADETYQQTLLSRLGVPRWQAVPLLTRFSRFRLQGYGQSDEDQRILEAYRDTLRRQNLVDFDDLLLFTHELLRSHPEVLTAVASRWDALLVDEFQDLSHTQYALIRLLAPHRHLFAVGDDEQSIYGWAGADPALLDAFRRDYGITEPIVLERNWRSARQIFHLARRILEANPALFEKRLTAERESAYPVRAVAFETEREEAAWLVNDLLEDHRASGTPWGQYAVLYRRHDVGLPIERSLLRAGIPLRLARGRALMDDELIAEVLGSLRLLLHPDDPVALDALVRAVLPEPLRDRIRAEVGGDQGLASLRLFARLRRGSEIERRQVMRLVHHVENLPALQRLHRSLPALIDALLVQRPSVQRSLLEKHAEELSDPEEYPGAPELAAALARAREAGGALRVTGSSGMALALQGMVRAGGLAAVLPSRGAPALGGGGPLDLVIPGDEPGAPLRLFKALQLLAGGVSDQALRDCVTFDLETTDLDVERCGILEIGAARVRDGAVVDRFHALVRPGRAIHPEATAAHGYTDADLAGAPTLAEVWPGFRAFVGDDLLVAHNATRFDVPVLRRSVAAAGGDPGGLVVLDTYPLARSVIPESARLQDLARRFGVDPGRPHHALDDALTLAGVLEGLQRVRAAWTRRTAQTAVLDWLGLALALATGDRAPEEVTLLGLARYHTLGRFGEALARYEAAFGDAGPDGGPSLEELVSRLGGPALRQRLRALRSPAQRYPASVARLTELVSGLREEALEPAIQELLDTAFLSRSDGVEPDPERVSLLTLHATKGLEFSRVYIVGVEDHEIPGWRAVRDRLEDEFPEARRLLYVGMTRTRDRLVLTRVQTRQGRPAGGSRFLDELGITAEPGSAGPAGPAGPVPPPAAVEAGHGL